jgi:pyruvate ferredoxin oxidoreductase gamma subunit
VDDEPILLKCQIKHPDQVIIFDLSLVDEGEIAQELKLGGTILINTNWEIDSFKKLRVFKMGLVNASSIARSAGLGDTLNTAMLGAYVRFTNLVKVETLIEAVRVMVPAKAEANVRALKEAYEKVKIFQPEETN